MSDLEDDSSIDMTRCGCGNKYNVADGILCYSCEDILCGECFMLQENPYQSSCICYDCVIDELRNKVSADTILNEFILYKSKLKTIKKLNKVIEDLIVKIKELGKENEKLKLEILYRPNGQGYKQAEEHFKNTLKEYSADHQTQEDLNSLIRDIDKEDNNKKI